MHTHGPYAIIINTTRRPTQHNGLLGAFRFHYIHATLTRLHVNYDMMDYHVEIRVLNFQLSPVFEICLSRPYEYSARPPINHTCHICLDRRTCTLIPCYHFLCYQCAVFCRFYFDLNCSLCRDRVECVIRYE